MIGNRFFFFILIKSFHNGYIFSAKTIQRLAGFIPFKPLKFYSISYAYGIDALAPFRLTVIAAALVAKLTAL